MGMAIAAALDRELAQRVAQDIYDVVTVLHTKRDDREHGAWLFYDDGLIAVAFNEYHHLLEAWLGDVTVFRQTGSTPPTTFRPGYWTGYLHGLAERAREQRRQERAAQNEAEAARLTAAYGPVDDADLFGVERNIA